ncbi:MULTISPECIES: FAD-dependent monooxygenase [unclassified Amycolatopsis]|uniref:FAD-dependent monooxygenase n=1 Tax=unclassified Amycolatopsis TaxID=2618356 RepID=UPI0028771F23|nr:MULTISPECIES: FAD-dependent monooxygenase [unclassified Amycolatopsis]MDS0139699.1 FAD-dependent monooxygenase [Amycolatopsis sp. 505]MDS0145122.1 FAD-dependent monooxygenase [Amycolatopsis sp. CM201R]
MIPVLIAGGGTVGLSTALFLAGHGVPALVVERAAGPSPHPRATGLGFRTMEFFRQAGIHGDVEAVAVRASATLGKISAPTLATADLPDTPPAVPNTPNLTASELSPGVLRGTCPQDRLDAVLLSAARERGATVAYSTTLVSTQQDDSGVTAVLDGPDGRQTVRASYLVAADGSRSEVRAALGIGTTGPGALGQPLLNILFRADLTPYTKGHHFANCTITTPESPGMLVTVDGEKDWIFHTGLGDEPAEAFPPDRCRALIRAAVGDPDLAVEVLSALPWRVRGLLADRFRAGRVFLAGDAAHAVPPLGAFGANTGIADAHNLAWKLAAVLDGSAGPALLDTYEAERRPVAALALEQALLRLEDPRLHWEQGPAAAAARAAAGVVNAPIVHLGFRYASTAVLGARTALPSTEDVILDGTPGSRVPHTWLGDGLSTLDLVGRRLTLLAGPSGRAWLEAAQRLDVDAHVVEDETWLSTTGIAEGGAVLVRPDHFVAWRSTEPAGDLGGVVAQILAR